MCCLPVRPRPEADERPAQCEGSTICPPGADSSEARSAAMKPGRRAEQRERGHEAEAPTQVSSSGERANPRGRPPLAQTSRVGESAAHARRWWSSPSQRRIGRHDTRVLASSRSRPSGWTRFHRPRARPPGAARRSATAHAARAPSTGLPGRPIRPAGRTGFVCDRPAAGKSARVLDRRTGGCRSSRRTRRAAEQDVGERRGRRPRRAERRPAAG